MPMNKIPLNIAGLDGGVIIKKGGGGGVTIKNQDKSLEIVENGTTEVTADAEFTGLSKVSVNVAIPNEQKTVDITENGRTEIVAEEGFLSKAIVNVNVPITGEVASKDVNFYDYDGTLLYSYTWDEAVALTELPPLPKQKGLICQEWNYTLDDIKAQTHHMADVGATYTTDDGRTRLYLKIDTDIIPELKIAYYTTEDAEIEFDWGDGSPVDSFTTSSATKGVISHQYSEKGEYVISVYSSDIRFCFPTVVTNTNLNCFGNSESITYEWLKRVEFAHYPNTSRGHSTESAFAGFPFLEYATMCVGGYGRIYNLFDNCTSLKSLVLPKGTTEIDSVVWYCSSLKFISMPNTMTRGASFRGTNTTRLIIPEQVSGTSWLQDMSQLETLAIPKGISSMYESPVHDRLKKAVLSSAATKVPDYMLRNARLLEHFDIPDSVTSIGSYAFYFTSRLRKLILPKGLQTISNNAFNGCGVMGSLKIPNGVTSIGKSAFQQMAYLQEVDFSEHTYVPTLADANAFSYNSDELKIIVPVSLYDEWISATNWSSLADKIVSDYTPTECLSLEITAGNVSGRKTSAKVSYTAITNGVNIKGERVTNVTITGTGISATFPQNTSYTDTVERTISYTYLGVTATTTIIQGVWIDARYTLDLNGGQWALSDTVANPNAAVYDGVYQSVLSKGVSNGSDTMYIDIVGYEDFKLYVRSYGESGYDYVMVSQLDQAINASTSDTNTSLVKASTKNKANGDTSINGYTLVEFAGIDGGEHRITIVYRKDGSGDNNDDRGYVLIPKNQ